MSVQDALQSGPGREDHVYNLRVTRAVLYVLSVVTAAVLVVSLASGRPSTGRRLERGLPRLRHIAAAELATASTIEGFGRNTLGGLKGKLSRVTSLADSGQGTLREFVENQSGPRIIKFAVSGTILLRSDLNVRKPFITIDGSDAPDAGIAIRNGTLSIQTHEVIIRHIRVRIGPNVPNPGSSDSLRIEGRDAYNVVVDHCSISWALDENLSIVDGARDVSVQWCIISEGLMCNPTNPHPERCHSKGLFVSNSDNGRVSLVHNLIAHNFARNPEVDSGDVEIVNNLIFNHGSGPMGMELWEAVHANVLSNYFQVGLDSIRQKYVKQIRIYDFLSGASRSTIYVSGNLGYERLDDSVPQIQMIEDVSRLVGTRHPFPITYETDAMTARNDVLVRAGATLPCRDIVDRRVLGNAKVGSASGLRKVVPDTGRIINDPSEVGGWPDLSKPCNSDPAGENE